MSSSDRHVLFRMDRETSAASPEFRWPSGAVQTLTNVPAGQILKLEEPQ